MKMIAEPDFDVMKYTKNIEGTPYLEAVEDVPERLQAAVYEFVREFNWETMGMLLGGDSP